MAVNLFQNAVDCVCGKPWNAVWPVQLWGNKGYYAVMRVSWALRPDHTSVKKKKTEKKTNRQHYYVALQWGLKKLVVFLP